MHSKGQEFVAAKPTKLSKFEELIKTLKKQLHKSELRSEKYKQYYKSVKEIARKYKAKFDEINEKLQGNKKEEISGEEKKIDENEIESNAINQINLRESLEIPNKRIFSDIEVEVLSCQIQENNNISLSPSNKIENTDQSYGVTTKEMTGERITVSSSSVYN